MKGKGKRFLAMVLAFVVVLGSCMTSGMTVEAATKVKKLTLSQTSASTYVGGTLTLKVKSVTPAKASKAVTWSSSDNKIATVTRTGKVTAKKTGTVTITAKSKSNLKVTAKCKIKVYKATKTLKLSSSKSCTLQVGQTKTLSAKVTSPKSGAQPVTWTSKNKKIATVTSKGKVKAVSAGKTTITGKSGSKSVKVTVTVKKKNTSKPTPTPTPTPTPIPTPTPDDTEKPSDDTEKPSDDTQNPSDNTEKPSDDTENPSDEGNEPGADSAAYTRAEWVKLLVEKMGYAVSEDELLKDSDTGKIRYSYDDIFDSSKALEIETAVQNGVFPEEMTGSAVDYLFYPEYMATREFAAVTAVTALGCAPGEALECSDSNILLSAKEDKIAVDLGMLSLKDGAFCPNDELSPEEAEQILAKAEELLAKRTIDESHEDVITYTEAVVEESADMTDYTVGVSSDGEQVLVTLPLGDDTQGLEAGQILMLPATEDFPDGLPYKIASVVSAGEQVVLAGEIPEYTEIFDEVSMQGYGEIDWDEFVPAEGVTVVETENPVNGDDPASVESCGLDVEDSVSVNKTLEFSLEDEDDIAAEATVSVTIERLEYKIDYNKNLFSTQVNEVYIKVPNSVKLSCQVSGEKSGKKELGTIPVKLPAGFSVDVAVSITYGLDGSVGVKLGLDSTVGASYTSETGLSAIRQIDSKTADLTAEVNGKLGAELSVAFTWAEKPREKIREILGKEGEAKNIYSVGLEAGVQLSADMTTRAVEDMVCVNAGAYLYVELNVGENSVLAEILPELEHTFSIVDKDNGPCICKIHIENGTIVKECTYDAAAYDIKLVDGETGAELSDASVTLRSIDTPSSGGWMDSSGHATGNISAGQYTISAAKSGYQPQVSMVVLKTGETATLVISLWKHGGKETAGSRIVHAGTYHGMSWTINENGKLVVSGTYVEWDWNYSNGCGSGWESYASEILSAVVTAEGVTSTRNWFSGCENLKYVDMSGFNTGDVSNMHGMFEGCSGLTSLNVSGFNTKNVLDMSNMFYDCNSLTSLDVSSFDTEIAKSMSDMFYGCSGLSSLDVSGFDTGNVEEMYGMFSKCSGLTSLDVSRFNTEKVNRMESMFSGCSNLTSLDVSGFDTGKVWDMNYMFSGCGGLTSLDVSNFNTENVTDMNHMFSGCRSLTSLDVSGLDTGNVTYMSNMFEGCSRLTSLDVSGFDTGNVTEMQDMFSGCTALQTIKVPLHVKETVAVDLPATFTAENGTTYTTLPQGVEESFVLTRVTE